MDYVDCKLEYPTTPSRVKPDVAIEIDSIVNQEHVMKPCEDSDDAMTTSSLDSKQSQKQMDEQEQKQKEEETLRNSILQDKQIQKKLNLYTNILNEACLEMKEKKLSLDLYYSYLDNVSSYSQTSIIGLSAASTFVQSLIPSDEQDDWVKIFVLSITSYSGLVLAISKFYKLDEKKENAHNLRDRFADLQTKIQYFVDYIKPWKDKAHYQHIENGKDKVTEWIGLIDKIENEYHAIIDSKRELSSNYDKIIDTYVTKKYTRKYLRVRFDFEKERNKLQKLKDDMEVKEKKRKSKLEQKANRVNLDNELENKRHVLTQIKLQANVLPPERPKKSGFCATAPRPRP